MKIGILLLLSQFEHRSLKKNIKNHHHFQIEVHLFEVVTHAINAYKYYRKQTPLFIYFIFLNYWKKLSLSPRFSQMYNYCKYINLMLALLGRGKKNNLGNRMRNQ